MRAPIYVVTLLMAACASSSPQQTASPAPVTEEVRSQMMREGMRVAVPAASCAGEAYRNCFMVTEAECLVAAQIAADRCSPEFAQRYPLVTSPEAAGKAGAEYAACVHYVQALNSGHDVKSISGCLSSAFAKRQQ